MSTLIYLTGAVVILALVVRGATAFYDDFKKKTKQTNTENNR